MKNLNGMKIQMQLVTPLVFIERDEKEKDRSNLKPENEREEILVTKIKRKYYVIEPNNYVDVEPAPYYSANAYRGLLRRVMSSFILEKALQKNINFTLDDYFIMMAGGKTEMSKKLPIDTENEIRKLNPVASLFGFGLVMSGKLVVTDFEIPEEYRKYGKNLIKEFTFTKRDDIVNATEFRKYYHSVDDINKHIKEADKLAKEKKNKNNKDNTNNGNKDKKKVNVGHIQTVEYTVSGVKFNGFIFWKEDLTEIEKGALFKAIVKAGEKQIGSFKSKGFGIVNYHIFFDFDEDEIPDLEIISPPDRPYKKEIIVPEEVKKTIEVFDEWLENITEDNVCLNKFFK